MNGDVLSLSKELLLQQADSTILCAVQSPASTVVSLWVMLSLGSTQTWGVPGATGHRRMGMPLNIEGEHEGFAIEVSWRF